MATKKIADVPCWHRPYGSAEEAIGMTNMTRRQFYGLRKEFPTRVRPNMAGQYKFETVYQYLDRYQGTLATDEEIRSFEIADRSTR